MPNLFKIQAALALLFAAHAAPAATISANDMARPEGTRKFLLAAPQQAAAGKRPLVIMLHGHGMSARSMLYGATGLVEFKEPSIVWLDIVDRERILLAAPDGWKGSDGKRGWNDCRADATSNPATDDVGFLGALIDKAVAEHNVDPDRIYVVGASNGGGMAYRAAIELAPRLAGVSVVAALMPAQSACKQPVMPISLLAIHGTDDQISPYAGGKVSHWSLSGRGSGIGAEASVNLWRELAKLPAAPVVSPVTHRDPADDTSATTYVWGTDPAWVQVQLVKIAGGGHNPPSPTIRLPWLVVKMVGKQNGDVEFAEEAWRFFKDKRRAAVAE